MDSDNADEESTASSEAIAQRDQETENEAGIAALRLNDAETSSNEARDPRTSADEQNLPPEHVLRHLEMLFGDGVVPGSESEAFVIQTIREFPRTAEVEFIDEYPFFHLMCAGTKTDVLLEVFGYNPDVIYCYSALIGMGIDYGVSPLFLACYKRSDDWKLIDFLVEKDDSELARSHFVPEEVFEDMNILGMDDFTGNNTVLPIHIALYNQAPLRTIEALFGEKSLIYNFRDYGDDIFHLAVTRYGEGEVLKWLESFAKKRWGDGPLAPRLRSRMVNRMHDNGGLHRFLSVLNTVRFRCERNSLDGLQCFFSSLSAYPKIQTLSVESDQGTDRTCFAGNDLESFLRLDHLQKLEVFCKPHRQNLGTMDLCMNQIASGLQFTTNLRSLRLSHFKLESDDAVLVLLRRLTCVALNGFQIEEEDVRTEITERVNSMETSESPKESVLEVVQLQGNKVSGIRMLNWTSLIARSPKLKTLVISNYARTGRRIRETEIDLTEPILKLLDRGIIERIDVTGYNISRWSIYKALKRNKSLRGFHCTEIPIADKDLILDLLENHNKNLVHLGELTRDPLAFTLGEWDRVKYLLKMNAHSRGDIRLDMDASAFVDVLCRELGESECLLSPMTLPNVFYCLLHEAPGIWARP